MRAQQEPLLSALGRALLDEPARAAEPSRRLRLLRGSVQQDECEPERAPRRTNRLAALQKSLVRARPCIGARRIIADEKRGDRKAIEIFGLERRLAVRLRKQGAGVGPRLPLEGVSAATHRPGAGHRPYHRALAPR